MGSVEYIYDGITDCELIVEILGNKAKGIVYISDKDDCVMLAEEMSTTVSKLEKLFDEVDLVRINEYTLKVFGSIGGTPASVEWEHKRAFITIRGVRKDEAIWITTKMSKNYATTTRLSFTIGNDEFVVIVPSDVPPEVLVALRRAIMAASNVRYPPAEAVVIAALMEKVGIKPKVDYTDYYNLYAQEVTSAKTLREALEALVWRGAVRVANDVYVYGVPAGSFVSAIQGSTRDFRRFIYILVKMLTRLHATTPEELGPTIAVTLIHHSKGMIIYDSLWKRIPLHVKRTVMGPMTRSLVYRAAMERPHDVDDETLKLLRWHAALRYETWKETVGPGEDELFRRMFTRGEAKVKNGIFQWRGFSGYVGTSGEDGIHFIVVPPGGVKFRITETETFEDAVARVKRTYNADLLFNSVIQT